MDKAATALSPAEFRRHLFYETSHSPSLAELVGYEKAKEIIDFCFIANPYYPTTAMLRDLQDNFPNLIKSYPSSNPASSQKHLGGRIACESGPLDHWKWRDRTHRPHQYDFN